MLTGDSIEVGSTIAVGSVSGGPFVAASSFTFATAAPAGASLTRPDFPDGFFVLIMPLVGRRCEVLRTGWGCSNRCWSGVGIVERFDPFEDRGPELGPGDPLPQKPSPTSDARRKKQLLLRPVDAASAPEIAR